MNRWVFAILFFAVTADAHVRKRSVTPLREKVHHQDPTLNIHTRGLFERPSLSEIEGFPEDDGFDDVPDLPDFSDLFGGSTRPSRDRFSELMRELYSGLFEENPFERSEEDNAVRGPGGDIFSRVFGELRPWWKGENTCVREDEYEEEDDEPTASDGFFEGFTTTSTQCYTTDASHKCIMKMGKNGKTKVHSITHECCHGFAREDGKKGCTKELNLKPLMDTLESLNMTSFVEAIRDLGLEEKLNSGNFTIFAPRPEAMTEVAEKEGISGVVLESGDQMKFVREIVENHVTSGWTMSPDFYDEMAIPSLVDNANLRINFFSYPNRFITTNCARMTSRDHQATNGIVHVVDRLLLPATQTVAQIVQTHPQLSAMRNIIKEEDMNKLENPESVLTMFAFNDDAFEALPAEMRQRIENGDECVKDLLHEHLVPHTICSAAVLGKAVVKNMAGRYLNLTRPEENKEVILIEDGTILTPDKVATNGVVHIIDRVLLSDKMLDALSAASKRNGDVFVNLLNDVGAKDEIASLPEKTILIPPNEKLMEAADNFGPDKEGLKQALLGHVVDRKIELSLENRDERFTALNGKSMKLRIEPLLGFSLGSLVSVRASLQCANVILGNMETCDGVVHYLDRVLEMPTKTVLEALRSNANYSQFVMLIEAAGLEEELSGPDLGTVLAPSNQAFEKLEPSTVDALLNDRPKLKQFVLTHILQEQLCCNALGGDFLLRARHRTKADSALYSYNYGMAHRIGQAQVQACDNVATNGIIHGLNNVVIAYLA